MLANKHTRNVCSLSAPLNHKARGVLAQDGLARTPLWSTMMKRYPSTNGHRDLKQADGNNSGRLALSPMALICPPTLLGHHPMVTSLLDLSEVIIQPMKDGNGERTFEHGPIVTMSCHRWDSNAKFALRANPAATHSRPEWHPMVRGIIPCPSSQPPEDDTTREPEPEVAPTQSTEEPNDRPATPRSIIIIDDMPVGSPPPPPTSSYPTRPPSPSVPPLHSNPCSLPRDPFQCRQEPQQLLPPVQRPSHSNDEACQEFTNLRPTLMIPRAIVHESINRILLEHCRLLHMIPFMDATHQNEMHWEFREELNSLLAQALEAYPKEDITGIVSKYLEK
ncbi:hypothetical protein O181_059916 [Austropuccinia psidii MF-1]|uniref:Uncharacterized protein n=1 Tax=Austropuccinia psidii MF-1 TaxID=1389203 RepID=A0A9Q3ED40_9BASI|nr:hypothetical protein [Austropuccinia psidii MF-1]